MRQSSKLGLSSPEHHSSLISRLLTGIRAMKRYSFIWICLVSLAGLIYGYPNEMQVPLIVRHEIEKATSDPRYNDVDALKDEIARSTSTTIDFTSCSDNPEEEMTTVEFIRRSGYPVEEHFVTTDDGYILALHRIPGPEGSPIVLLHHALLESSFCWVITGKGRGLAYLLADAGYDVWMGNVRGNTYSRNHTTLDPSTSEFWNFSYHEMGIYDVPAGINYITSLKNDTLIYIGHSMGTTMFYVMASERPDVATKVRAMFSLAPVAYTYNIFGPFPILGSILRSLQKYMHFEGQSEFFSQGLDFKFIAKCICSRPLLKEICRSFIFSNVGFNVAQFNTTMLPLILSHTPAGTSLKTLIHFAQGIGTNKFLHYDYGEKDNRILYNSDTPPEYDLSKIRVPIALFWAGNDYLAEAKDVKKLYDRLPLKIQMYKIEDPNFNHLDFIWGVDASTLVYSKLLKLIKNY